MNIKIGKNAHTCAICETDFIHEQKINSLVRVVEGLFQREDFCNSCWEDNLAQGAYSTWGIQYYDPKVAEQEPEEVFSPLRKLFYDSLEDSSRPSIAIAYLAAQLLRRQKVFRLIKETKDPDNDSALILFNDRIGNRLIEVSDPNLAHSELDEARLQLMQRLTELETPEEPSNEDSPEDSPEVSGDSQAETEEHQDTETIEVPEHGSTKETAEA